MLLARRDWSRHGVVQPPRTVWGDGFAQHLPPPGTCVGALPPGVGQGESKPEEMFAEDRRGEAVLRGSGTRASGFELSIVAPLHPGGPGAVQHLPAQLYHLRTGKGEPSMAVGFSKKPLLSGLKVVITKLRFLRSLFLGQECQ